MLVQRRTWLLARPLEHHADCVRDALGRVQRVGGQEEHFALLDLDLLKLAVVHNAEVHGTLHLVKELFRRLGERRVPTW